MPRDGLEVSLAHVVFDPNDVHVTTEEAKAQRDGKASPYFVLCLKVKSKWISNLNVFLKEAMLTILITSGHWRRAQVSLCTRRHTEKADLILLKFKIW